MADKIDDFNFLNLFNAALLKRLRSLQVLSAKSNPSLKNIDPHLLEKRIFQVLLSFEGSEIRAAASKTVQSGNPLADFFRSDYRTQRVSKSWSTKKVTLTRRFTFYLYFKFILLWLRSHVLFLQHIFQKGKYALPDTQLKIWNTTISINGIGPEALQRFIEFCKSGQISALSAPLMIYSSGPIQSFDYGFYTARWPLFACLLSPKVNSLKAFYFFLSQQIKWLLIISFYFLKKDLLLLLMRDFAQFPLIYSLQKFSVISDYFLSVSDFTEQPLWLQDKSFQIRSHMVWYSSNSRTYTFKNEEYRIEYENPFLFLIQVDEHWLWDSMWKDWAKSIFNTSRCHFVGPILLYSDQSAKKKRTSSSFCVSIFDVAPLNEQESFSKYSGMGFNYFSNKIARQFIADIIAAVSIPCREEKIDYILQIKPKRIYSSKSRSQEYSNYLNELIDSNQLTALPHNSSIYEIIRNSDLVICFPFTSPAYVARHLNVPVCFYDPTNIISSNFSGLPLFQDKQALAQFISNCLFSFLENNKQKDQSN